MKKLILGMLLCLAIAPATAAPAFCSGKILHVLTYADGFVMVLPDFRGDWTAICNLNSDWKGVSPITCVSWLATVTRAQSKAPPANVGIWYADAPSCAAVSTYYSAPAPVYLMSQ
jgi:hypothetical protein